MAATLIAIVLLAGFLALGVLSWRRRLTSGCCGAGGDTVKKLRVHDRDPRHYPFEQILDVEGMTCKNCAARVENALNALDGVYAAVNLHARRATVRMKQPLPLETLCGAVERAGYEPRAHGQPAPRPAQV